MMSKLAERGAQILFVQPNKKKPKFHSELTRQSENIWVLTCRGVPYERCLRTVNKFNSKLTREDIVKAAEEIGFNDPIIWLDRVHGFDYQYFSQFGTVYDLVDEILAFGRFRNSKMLIELENNVLKKVDLLISSSQTLLKRKVEQSGRKGESVFIPNGVDTDRFQAVESKEKGNVIGFVGQISDRSINMQLIQEVAQNHPEWKFVFTGPGTQESKKNLCKDFPNIIVNDPVSGAEIPKVIESYDICMIPYLHTKEDMDYVFPRKACEYLAAGKPVVSTDLKEVRYLEPMVLIADSPKEFEKAIEKAFSDNRTEEKKIFSKQFDWEILIPQLLEKMNKIL